MDLGLRELAACFLPRAPPPVFISAPFPIPTSIHWTWLARGPSPAPSSPPELGPVKTVRLTKTSFSKGHFVAKLLEQYQAHSKCSVNVDHMTSAVIMMVIIELPSI